LNNNSILNGALINRREALIGGLAGVGASLLASPTLAASASNTVSAASGEHMVSKVKSEFLFFDDPVAKLHAHLRMGRDLGDETDTITWYHIMVFVVPLSSPPIPLVRYEGMEFSYLRHLGNNNFRLQAHNLSFPRDLETGEFTDTVLNPITGETVEIPPTIITTDPGTVQNQVGFRNVNGDGIYQVRYSMFRIEDNLIKKDDVRGAPPDMPITHQENSCSWVPYDEFTNPTISSLPNHFVGTYMYEYPQFLKMGDRPGILTSMFDGKKINSVEELPDDYLDRARREHPELLKPLWKAFDTPLSFEL
jgi:hypothetical protein